jgi:hypothetical protein
LKPNWGNVSESKPVYCVKSHFKGVITQNLGSWASQIGTTNHSLIR